MATDDQSLATLTENWIITQIKAIQIDAVDVFDDLDVTGWAGSIAEDRENLAEDLAASQRRLSAHVAYDHDEPVEMEEGTQFFDALYTILVCVQNERPGASRRGDGVDPGTNIIRELLIIALHNKNPSLNSNNLYAVDTRWRGFSVDYLRRDMAILVGTLAVREEWSNA